MSTLTRSNLLVALAVLAIVVAVPNFIWFVAESGSQGGDALNGYVAAGHYFLASHGIYTEVGAGTWEWSRMHALSVLATLPFAVAGAVYLTRRLIRYAATDI